VEQPKPDKAAYSFALKNITESAGDCVAIEDNVDGVRAAVAAGLACVAFPNQNTVDHDFAAAVGCVDRLDVQELQQFAGK
jgi:beta-phosphoglucomutase-like phosphatase (HAD superfamily)